MVRRREMIVPKPITRRSLIGGVAAATTLGILPGLAASESGRVAVALTLKDSADGPVFVSEPGSSDGVLRFRQGDRLRLAVTNALSVPVALSGPGFAGVPALQPLVAQPPIQAGATLDLDLPLVEAGTFALDARLLADSRTILPVASIVVAEARPYQADQDHLLLFEDARRRDDGTHIAPGTDAARAPAVYRVNGRPEAEIAVNANERVRLRLINGCHRNAIALQISEHAVQIVAMDSRPAEPFPARDGRLVLAPGTRIDVVIDATGKPGATSPIMLFDGTGPKQIARIVYGQAPPVRPQPLPPSALPAPQTRLELQGAFRTEIPVPDSGNARDWRTPQAMLADRGQPAFRVKRGRTTVLTLKNPSGRPAVFRLHGHHFRWLDRLDDGWKPFLLDTFVLDAGQTERVAFAAPHAGSWLLESAALEWSAPKLLRWFAVD